jgi:NAD(P)-dependent dehydrogenase (short-subunit alcohol dehydrogenase family)
MSGWTATDMPSLSGRVAIVTGANRGLGLVIATELAAHGARIVLPVRDPAKGEAAADRLRSRVPGATVEVDALDVADLGSVARFAQAFGARHARCDLLINNAAAILAPKGRTKDGFETHIGTNFFGAFALTGHLLERLEAAPAARVVNCASLAHRLTPGLDLQDLEMERVDYKEMDAYGRSKLALLLFTRELDRRLRARNSPVIAVAAHPGYTNTNPDVGGIFMRLATRIFAQSPQMGALPALHAATAPDVKGGEYYGPSGMKELTGPPKRVDARPEAKDDAAAARLWDIAQQRTGVRWLAA